MDLRVFRTRAHCVWTKINGEPQNKGPSMTVFATNVLVKSDCGDQQEELATLSELKLVLQLDEMHVLEF